MFYAKKAASTPCSLSAWLLSGAILLPAMACESSAPAAEIDQGASFRMALTADTDVSSYRLSVRQIACDGEVLTDIPYEQIWNVPVSGITNGGGEIIDDPLSASSSFSFGQWDVPLDPGCYEADAVPLQADGSPSLECAATNSVPFEVTALLTEEVTLIANCPEGGVGVGDTAILQNHAPGLEIVAGTTTSLACVPLEVCVRAWDDNGDPLEFQWIADPSVEIIAGEPSPVQEDGSVTQCAQIRSDVAGQPEVQVIVHDLLADGSRIEDHPSVQGISHAELSFGLHIIDDSASCDDPNGTSSFVYLGEGECRQGDGAYPLKFSLGYYDLNPHTAGDNAAQAQARCEATCLQYASWCLAVEVVTRDIWPTPECRLVTDRATFEGSGNVLENNSWGGSQNFDGVSYQTYCGGNGDCTATNWAGGSLNARAGYHCSHLVSP